MRLGFFELQGSIGRGGMGEVWLGVHTTQRLSAAVKVLTGERSSTALFREGFAREVRAASRLSHRGIIGVWDHGVVSGEEAAASGGALAAGSPYMVMELANRGGLESFRGGRTWPWLRGVLAELLDALAHAHARGVIHRDIKPRNVLLSEEVGGALQLKLSDFGIAYPGEAFMEDSRMVPAGTHSYMAPEQILGRWRDQGPWTDLYAVGCMAWELLVGRPPFDGQEGESPFLVLHRHLREPVPSLPEGLAVPAGFEAWLGRLLAKHPRGRFRFAADALEALLALEPEGEAVWQSVRFSGEFQVAAASAGVEQETQPLSAAWLTDLAAFDWGALAPEALPPPAAGARVSASWRKPSERLTGAPLLGVGAGLWGLRSPPLVGRHRERDQLWEALRQVEQAGQAQVVVLRGGGGVGRSALGAWLCQRAHELGAAHSMEGSGGPGWLASMLSGWLGCAGLEGDALRERVEAECGEGVLGVQALVELLEGGGEAWAALPLLEEVSGARPLILWLDDAHRSPEALAWAGELLERRLSLPVLLVLGLHQGEAQGSLEVQRAWSSLGRQAGVSVVELAPLSAEEQQLLVQASLGLAPEVAAAVAERTDGNPRLALELVGDWVTRGILSAGPGGYSPRAGEVATVPASIAQRWEEALAPVLAQEPEGASVALEAAAVLGGVVEEAVWSGVCAQLGAARSSGLVERLIGAGLASRCSSGWVFSHGMLRESLERQASDGGRLSRLHRACAATLEARAGQGARGWQAAAGRHLMWAGEQVRALPLLRAGFEGLLSRGALLEGLEVLSSLLGEAEGSVQRRARLGRGWTLLRLGRLAEAYHAFEETSLLLGGVDAALQAEAEVGWAATCAAWGRVAEARLHLEDAAPQEGSWAWARAAQVRGALAEAQGDAGGAAAQLAAALAAFRDRGEGLEALEVSSLLAGQERQSGQLEAAEGALRLLLAQAEALGCWLVWPLRLGLGLTGLGRGQEAASLELLGQVAQAAEASGAARLSAQARAGAAACAAALGLRERLHEEAAALERRDYSLRRLGEEACWALRWACSCTSGEDRALVERLLVSVSG